MVRRLQAEIANEEYSAEELALATKAIEDVAREKRQLVTTKYSPSAERDALDTIFRLVALYVLKNCQGADLTQYQTMHGEVELGGTATSTAKYTVHARDVAGKL